MVTHVVSEWSFMMVTPFLLEGVAGAGYDRRKMSQSDGGKRSKSYKVSGTRLFVHALFDLSSLKEEMPCCEL